MAISPVTIHQDARSRPGCPCLLRAGAAPGGNDAQQVADVDRAIAIDVLWATIATIIATVHVHQKPRKIIIGCAAIELDGVDAGGNERRRLLHQIPEVSGCS